MEKMVQQGVYVNNADLPGGFLHQIPNNPQLTIEFHEVQMRDLNLENGM